MKRLIALTAVLCLFSGVARADLVTVRTAAGPITVASDVAHRFVSLIDDLVARGFHGRVHCYSTSHSHVKHSQHFSGRACDFAQRGWNKTVHPMYSSTALIQAHSLRDGCTFHSRKDCGHVDAGLSRSPVAKLWAYGHKHRVVAQQPDDCGLIDARGPCPIHQGHVHVLDGAQIRHWHHAAVHHHRERHHAAMHHRHERHHRRAVAQVDFGGMRCGHQACHWGR